MISTATIPLRLRSIAALGAIALSLAGAAESPPATTQAGEDIFPFEVTDKPLDIVLQWLSRRAGVNIVCNETEQPKVTLRLVNVTWREVVDQIARRYDFVLEKRSDRILEMTRPPKVRMQFQDARLSLILEALARQAGMNIIISDKVSGTRRLTMSLNAVPWRTALDVIVKSTGYSWMEQEYKIIRILDPRDVEKDLETRVQRLNYAEGKEIGTLIKVALSKDGKAEHDPRTNSLVLTDTVQNLAASLDILRQLDVRTQEVQIEMRLVQFTMTDALQFGFDGSLNFDWKNVGAMSSTLFPFSIQGTRGLQAPANNQITSASLKFMATATWDSTEIIQCPNVLTLNNQQAQIQISQETHFAEQTVTVENGATLRSLSEAKGSPVTDGIKITVTPYITHDGFVSLNLDMSDSAAVLRPLTMGDTTISLPYVEARKVKTTILVPDGETAVIGGLLKQKTGEIENKVPVLGNIPLLGFFFRNKNETSEKRNLTIFITPRIVPLRDKDELEDAKVRLREELSGLKLREEKSNEKGLKD